MQHKSLSSTHIASLNKIKDMNITLRSLPDHMNKVDKELLELRQRVARLEGLLTMAEPAFRSAEPSACNCIKSRVTILIQSALSDAWTVDEGEN